MILVVETVIPGRYYFYARLTNTVRVGTISAKIRILKVRLQSQYS